MSIREELFSLRDEKYAVFSAKLMPGVPLESVIGVRSPLLRNIAKRMLKDGSYKEFLDDLPHEFFDEKQLHSMIISGIKDYDEALAKTIEFLPHIDNWSNCDVLSPKCFKKHKEDLLKNIRIWMSSDHTYTIRFGIDMLMTHFLDEDFDEMYLEEVSKIRSEEYYVNMMKAWYFATALAKQYDAAVKYIEDQKLDKWSHNKSIQKAVESFRVTDEHKAYLKTLRVK